MSDLGNLPVSGMHRTMPGNMSLEEFRTAYDAASSEQEAILRADPTRNRADPTLPVSQLFGRLSLEEERERFAAGDRVALLAAVRECARCGLPMPEWVAAAFIRSYDQVLNCRVKSWDEAFGAPFPKGSHLNALRKRRKLRIFVHSAVLDRVRRDPSTPIDKGLFESVGEEFSIGASLAEELYYSAVRRGMLAAADVKKHRR
jgi:hypothetical protein